MQRANRTLGPRPVARGGGAPAQLSLPRNLPSVSLQTHSRYFQHNNCFYIVVASNTLVDAQMHCETLALPLSSLLNIAGPFISCIICVLCPQSLIPDIRPCLGQEAVVDLHPEEPVLSGAEDEERERSDQDLQIRRTVTQVGLQLLTLYLNERLGTVFTVKCKFA